MGEFQRLRLSTSNQIALKHSYQESMVPDTPALFSGSYAQEPGERDYLVYTHASCIGGNRTVLCGLTLVYLTFQALVKMC